MGFTTGPAAPLGLRSEVVAAEELVAVVGRQHRGTSGSRRVSAVSDVVGGPFVVGGSRIGHARRDRARASPPRGCHRTASASRCAAMRRSGWPRSTARRGVPAPLLELPDDLGAGRLGEMTVRDLAVVQPVRGRVARRPSFGAPGPSAARRRASPRCGVNLRPPRRVAPAARGRAATPCVSMPPPNPVRWPLAPTTRWHGTMIGSGLRPLAAPTARALLGSPRRFACSP